MGNILSKHTKKNNSNKVNLDYYDLRQIVQTYGSDSTQIKQTGVDLNNYIDSYPNFKIWAKTRDIDEKLEEVTHKKEDELTE